MAHDLVTRDLLAREVAMLAIDRLVEDDLRTSAVRWLEHNIRYERLCVDISRKLSELQDLVVHIIVDLSK